MANAHDGNLSLPVSRDPLYGSYATEDLFVGLRSANLKNWPEFVRIVNELVKIRTKTMTELAVYLCQQNPEVCTYNNWWQRLIVAIAIAESMPIDLMDARLPFFAARRLTQLVGKHAVRRARLALEAYYRELSAGRKIGKSELFLIRAFDQAGERPHLI